MHDIETEKIKWDEFSLGIKNTQFWLTLIIFRKETCYIVIWMYLYY